MSGDDCSLERERRESGHNTTTNTSTSKKLNEQTHVSKVLGKLFYARNLILAVFVISVLISVDA